MTIQLLEMTIMSNDTGFLFFVGLLIISIAIGTEFTTFMGWIVLGIGIMFASLIKHLNDNVW